MKMGEGGIPRLFKPVVPRIRSSLGVCKENRALKGVLNRSVRRSADEDRSNNVVDVRVYEPGNTGPKTTCPLSLPNGEDESSSSDSNSDFSIVRPREVFNAVNDEPGIPPSVRPPTGTSEGS